MPKPFEHNGQNYEWSYEQNSYLPVDKDAGPLSAILNQGARGVMTGIGAVHELFGNDEFANRMLAEQDERVARSGAATSAVGPGQAARIGGEVLPYVAGGALAAPKGLGAVLSTEAGMGFAGTPGDTGARVAGAALAAGLAAAPGGALTLGQAVGNGVRATRVAGAAQSVFGQAMGQAKSLADEIGTGVKARATAAGLRNPNRSAGAAQADEMAPGRIETDQVLTGAEADDLQLPITPAQRARLDATEGSPLDEIEESLRLDENTALGRSNRSKQQEWLQQEVARETEIMGPVNKSAVSARLKEIGTEFDEIEGRAPFAGLEPDFVENWTAQLEAMGQRGTANTAKILKRVQNIENAADVKTAMRDVSKAIDSAKTAGDVNGARGLQGLRDDLRQQLVRGMEGDDLARWDVLRRQYAILKGLQGENILKPGGNFNLNSFIKKVAKNYEPFGTGDDMSPLSRALRTMETLNRSEVKGSNTAWLMGAGGLGIGSLLGQ